MPRASRAWETGAVYHLFARGSNRQAIFLNNGDYVDFMGVLDEALRRTEVEVFAWALMPNHWHLIARCPPPGLSKLMQRVNHRYALRFDRRWGRSAHVFENRFGSVLQEAEEQFLWTVRYVLRNPVEAGLCASPFDARWTSLQATIGSGLVPPYLCAEELLSLFHRDGAIARTRFVDFVLGDTGAGPLGSAARDALAPA